MKLNKIIAAALLATSASVAFAQAKDDLTTVYNVVVKDSSGNCVKVLGNVQVPECQPQMAKVVEAPKPKPAPQKIEEIKLGADAYFALNKYNLKPRGVQLVKELAMKLTSTRAHIEKITVVGNTDSTGTEQYNQKLSERRAATVANALVKDGVPANLIQAWGVGETQPVASNKTAEGRAKNRRVDITIFGTITVK